MVGRERVVVVKGGNPGAPGHLHSLVHGDDARHEPASVRLGGIFAPLGQVEKTDPGVVHKGHALRRVVGAVVAHDDDFHIRMRLRKGGGHRTLHKKVATVV